MIFPRTGVFSCFVGILFPSTLSILRSVISGGETEKGRMYHGENDRIQLGNIVEYF